MFRLLGMLSFVPNVVPKCFGMENKGQYSDMLKRRVWVFPDNVDTDAIALGKYLDDINAILRHICESIDKEFSISI